MKYILENNYYYKQFLILKVMEDADTFIQELDKKSFRIGEISKQIRRFNQELEESRQG